MDKIRSDRIRNELGTASLINFVEKRQLEWWGHLQKNGTNKTDAAGMEGANTEEQKKTMTKIDLERHNRKNTREEKNKLERGGSDTAKTKKMG